jgi:two-component system nitrogen regulation response regulator GlnG
MNRRHDAPPRVLIIADEQGVRWSLSRLIKREGFLPLPACDGTSGLKILREGLVDAVLLDIRLPGTGGLEVLAEAKRAAPSVPVILMTAFASVELAVEAMKKGAHDLVTKPFDTKAICATLRQALQVKSACAPSNSRGGAGAAGSLRETLGSSKQMQKVAEQIRLVAQTDYSVLIMGETGAGKEVVAQAIHGLSKRANGPLVPVNCGSIPSSLIENELFGHEKGAYTGAADARIGMIEAASGGTLFLDEVSTLPLSMQPKLLRVSEDRRICRVGGTTPRGVDIRILAATNENLGEMVRKGQFRSDLYYRLNEVGIVVPPLRECGQDIVLHARRFLDEAASELGKPVKGFSAEAAQALLSHEWPGNVRQLRSMMRRAVLRCRDYVTQQDLQFEDDASPPQPQDTAPAGAVRPVPLKEVLRTTVARVERDAISGALRWTGGNKAQAARLLGVDYKTIHSKVRQYGLSAVEKGGRDGSERFS